MNVAVAAFLSAIAFENAYGNMSTIAKLRPPLGQYANLTQCPKLLNGFLDNGKGEYVVIEDSKQPDSVNVVSSHPKLRLNQWWLTFNTLQYQFNMLIKSQPTQ